MFCLVKAFQIRSVKLCFTVTEVIAVPHKSSDNTCPSCWSFLSYTIDIPEAETLVKDPVHWDPDPKPHRKNGSTASELQFPWRIKGAHRDNILVEDTKIRQFYLEELRYLTSIKTIEKLLKCILTTSVKQMLIFIAFVLLKANKKACCCSTFMCEGSVIETWLDPARHLPNCWNLWLEWTTASFNVFSCTSQSTAPCPGFTYWESLVTCVSKVKLMLSKSKSSRKAFRIV